MIPNLALFFKGAYPGEYLEKSPYPKLWRLNAAACRINDKLQAEIARGSK